MSRKLTVHLDDVTVRKAKMLAARRSTSLSKLVASEIERLVDEDDEDDEDDDYENALQGALSHLERGFGSAGWALPDRASFHDREPGRR